jgi:hemerythrin-like domain-containing protein
MSKIEDPIRLLRDEHDKVLDVLDRMEAAAADLQGTRRGEALDRLRQGLQWLEQEVRPHSRLEEETLYPALARHVPAQTVSAMIEEHGEIAWSLDLVGRGLAGAGRPGGELRWQVTALVDQMRRHIDKENNVLFMMAAQMLSDHEYEGLARAIHALIHAGHREA